MTSERVVSVARVATKHVSIVATPTSAQVRGRGFRGGEPVSARKGGAQPRGAALAG